MSEQFYPITLQAAVEHLVDLPRRVSVLASSGKLGPEGRALRELARRQLRWHQLFRAMNRRGEV